MTLQLNRAKRQRMSNDLTEMKNYELNVSDQNPKSNTHYEYSFSENGKEISIYLERLDRETGIEVMFWIHKSWFDSGQEYNDLTNIPSVNEFCSEVTKFITNELGFETTPNIEYYQQANPWIVFTSVFYLD